MAEKLHLLHHSIINLHCQSFLYNTELMLSTKKMWWNKTEGNAMEILFNCGQEDTQFKN